MEVKGLNIFKEFQSSLILWVTVLRSFWIHQLWVFLQSSDLVPFFPGEYGLIHFFCSLPSIRMLFEEFCGLPNGGFASSSWPYFPENTALGSGSSNYSLPPSFSVAVWCWKLASVLA